MTPFAITTTRRWHGWTREEMGKRLGVSARIVREWEMGDREIDLAAARKETRKKKSSRKKTKKKRTRRN